MTVLDLSQYDLPTYDPACLKANGVTGIIFGVYHPSGSGPMRNAADQAMRAGIDVLGFYGLPYFGSPTGEARDISWAIENALILGVERVWIDCECDAAQFGFTDDVGATPERRTKVIGDLVKAIESAGLTAGIYTGAWWWSGKTLTDDFAHLPLWHAAYPDDGHEIRKVNYGGWSDVAIHQYTSSFNVCGRNRDANYVFMEGEVNQKDFDDLVLATFSGSEDRGADGKTLPREERLPIALDRMRNRADGGFGSVADRAESAYVLAQQAAPGAVPDLEGYSKRGHTHPVSVTAAINDETGVDNG